MNLFAKRLSAAALSVSLWPAVASADLQLMMFEQPGCSYCAQWTRDVGPKYPLTTEGKAAPLVHIDIHAQLPEGVSLNSQPVFTPTFVLLKDGIESARIDGYPGEDFFWGLLGQMIKEAE